MFYFAGLIHVNNPFYLNTKKSIFYFFVCSTRSAPLAHSQGSYARIACSLRSLFARTASPRSQLAPLAQAVHPLTHRLCSLSRSIAAALTTQLQFRFPLRFHFVPLRFWLRTLTPFARSAAHVR